MANASELSSRGLIRVTGKDAHPFLQGLVTADLDAVDSNGASLAALLTPQGKILFDFLVVRDGDDYLVDVARTELPALFKRLSMYRLRAAVELADISRSHGVVALWGEDCAVPEHGRTVRDPRLAALDFRIYGSREEIASHVKMNSTEEHWHTHRIAHGVPEGGFDFSLGEAFPHDADIDQLGGVSFDKGCYVGQEVVSRMQHRATARRRIVMVSAEEPLPASGTEIAAGAKSIGLLGSVSGGRGLALVRLDRAKAARDEGVPIMADTVQLVLTIPEWARFSWPEPPEGNDT